MNDLLVYKHNVLFSFSPSLLSYCVTSERLKHVNLDALAAHWEVSPATAWGLFASIRNHLIICLHQYTNLLHSLNPPALLVWWPKINYIFLISIKWMYYILARWWFLFNILVLNYICAVISLMKIKLPTWTVINLKCFGEQT